jgi:hypothetical protein
MSVPRTSLRSSRPFPAGDAGGETDERGALHYLTPARVVAAAGLVRDGITVSMSFPVDTAAAAHNPRPATHKITRLPGQADPGSLGFAMDYVGFDYHSDTHTHLDALCHVGFDGSLYNGQPCQQVTAEGAAVGSVEILRDGLVGRGVLLDVPRLRSVPWLEPGEHVFADDLEAAERAQGVTVGQGDILLIRTGHARRLAEVRLLGDRRCQGRAASDGRAIAGRASRRGTRVRREQRHRAEHDRGSPVPDPRPCHQRDGRPSPGLPAVGGPPPDV